MWEISSWPEECFRCPSCVPWLPCRGKLLMRLRCSLCPWFPGQRVPQYTNLSLQVYTHNYARMLIGIYRYRQYLTVIAFVFVGLLDVCIRYKHRPVRPEGHTGRGAASRVVTLVVQVHRACGLKAAARYITITDLRTICLFYFIYVW